MRRRIDRFVEEELIHFGEWFVDADWFGKERECINMFAHGFLGAAIEPGAAIENLTQITIETAAPQPTGYKRAVAPKDLVIWRDKMDTPWNQEWKVENYPWVVMEWKFKRIGKFAREFHQHDIEWLCAYTGEYVQTFGYLVRVYAGPRGRGVDWAKVARGALNDTNRRS